MPPETTQKYEPWDSELSYICVLRIFSRFGITPEQAELGIALTEVKTLRDAVINRVGYVPLPCRIADLLDISPRLGWMIVKHEINYIILSNAVGRVSVNRNDILRQCDKYGNSLLGKRFESR